MADTLPPLQQGNPLVDEKGRGKSYFILWLNNLVKRIVENLSQEVADKVSGPAGTVTDKAIVRWNGTDGRALQNSSVILLDDGTATFKNVKVNDDPIDPDWDGSLEVPTKNAVYDAFQDVSAGIEVDQGLAPIVASAKVLNFTGSGVSVTAGSGDTANIAISGGGGGGGGAHERDWLVPTTALFSLQNAGSASISEDINGNGVRVTAPTTSSNIRFLKDVAGPPAAPYTIISRFSQVTPEINSGSYLGIIILRNSTTGSIVLWGNYRDGYSPNRLAQTWSNYTTYAGNLISPRNTRQTPWWAVEVSATTIRYLTSPDGYNWYRQATSTTISSYPGAVNEIGVGVMVNGQDADTMINSYEVIAGTL